MTANFTFDRAALSNNVGAMKHAGKARKAAFKMILWTFIAGSVIWGVIFVASLVGAVLAMVVWPILLVLWVLFSIFTLYFFRDPNTRAPAGERLVVSPGHGKVDVIDTTTEPQFIGGECQRVSMFLSVMNVHVQNAPVSGKVSFFKYTTGQFINALRTESAVHNENALLGFETTGAAAQKVGVRLIAGVIARRIVPFVQAGDEVKCGDRISLIQFGSRVDVYLPLTAAIRVKIGDAVVGGETILAELAA